jgi:hypothetical protein
MSIDLKTVNFRTVNRDVLRSLARAHGVNGLTASGFSHPTYSATKDELVRGFEQARKAGKFGPIEEEVAKPNVSVKHAGVVVFLKGEGCRGNPTHIAAVVRDDEDELTILAEFEPEDMGCDTEDYEKFTTTLADLKTFVAAIESNTK